MNILRRKIKIPFIEKTINNVTEYHCNLGSKTIVIDSSQMNILSSDGEFIQNINKEVKFYQYYLDLDNTNIQIVEDTSNPNILRVVEDANFSTIIAIQSQMITNCTGFIDSVECLNGFPTTFFEFSFYTEDKSYLKGIIIVNQIDNNMTFGNLINKVISRIESNLIDVFFKKKLTVNGNDEVIRNFGDNPQDITEVVDRIVAIETVNARQDNKDLEQDSRIDNIEQLSSSSNVDLATLHAVSLSL